MESISKKLLSAGEILSRPAKRYREISEELTVLRKRADEIRPIMNQLVIHGKTETGESVFAKVGNTVIGGESDRKVLELQWYRDDLPIEGANRGVYRCTFSDVGCQLKVVVTFETKEYTFTSISKVIPSKEYIKKIQEIKTDSFVEFPNITDLANPDVRASLVVDPQKGIVFNDQIYTNITRVEAHGNNGTGFNIDDLKLLCTNAIERDVVVGFLSGYLLRINWVDCVYPQVWEFLDIKSSIKPRSDSNSKQMKSRTSFLLKILDPMQNIETYDPLDELMTFDLYKSSGFGDIYHVDLEMEPEEGLGITLSLFNANGEFLPKNASVICVTGFCPLQQTNKPGQLERCGKIRIGDALVAVQDTTVEPMVVNTRRDFLNYKPCSLARVSTLVKQARTNPPHLRFTFACAGTDHGVFAGTHNKLKAEVDQWKLKEKEWEKEKENSTNRFDEVCARLEQDHLLAENAVLEMNAVRGEISYLKQRVAQLQVQAMDAQRYFERQQSEASQVALTLESEKEAALERIVQLEESMSSMANEGQAWVNTIGTKDDALRALETEVRKLKTQNVSLENLIDEFSTEASAFKDTIQTKDSEIQRLTVLLEDKERFVQKANDEADVLTSKLRNTSDNYNNEIDRLKFKHDEAVSQLERMRDEWKQAQAHAKALQESNSNLLNALEEEKANEKIVYIEKAVPIVKTEEAKPVPQSNDNHAEILIAENTNLKAQLKSMKSRMQSLTTELGRLSELDQAVSEKNELVVQLQLEKATRLECEDELKAYKRALRQFAEQSKNESADSPLAWSRRPKIFDHLYRRLLSEDKSHD